MTLLFLLNLIEILITLIIRFTSDKDQCENLETSIDEMMNYYFILDLKYLKIEMDKDYIILKLNQYVISITNNINSILK